MNAPFGGISIDMSSFDQILKINHEDLDAIVQPGVTREGLNNYPRNTGLFFPIDPGANASKGLWQLRAHQVLTRCAIVQ